MEGVNAVNAAFSEQSKNRHSVLILRLQQCRDQTLILADIIPVHIDLSANENLQTLSFHQFFVGNMFKAAVMKNWRKNQQKCFKKTPKNREKKLALTTLRHILHVSSDVAPESVQSNFFFLILIFYFLIFILPQHTQTHRYCQTLKYRQLKMMWPPRQYWH